MDTPKFSLPLILDILNLQIQKRGHPQWLYPFVWTTELRPCHALRAVQQASAMSVQGNAAVVLCPQGILPKGACQIK